MLAGYFRIQLGQNVHVCLKRSLSSIPADQIGKSYSERQARRLAEQMKDVIATCYIFNVDHDINGYEV